MADKDNMSFEGTVKSNVLESLQEKFLRKFLIDIQPTARQKEEIAMILDVYKKHGISITEGQSIVSDIVAINKYLNMKYADENEEDIEY